MNKDEEARKLLEEIFRCKNCERGDEFIMCDYHYKKLMEFNIEEKEVKK